MRTAINSLPVELRQVVVMKEFEELTFQEIADALSLPLEYRQEPALYGVETVGDAAAEIWFDLKPRKWE